MPPIVERALLAGYRLLLQGYPRAFRDEFGAEMAGVFAECLRAAARQGGWRAAVTIGREVIQAPWQLLTQHWHSWQSAKLAAGASMEVEEMSSGRSTRVWRVLAAAVSLSALGLWLLAVRGWGLEYGITIPGLLVALPLVGWLAWLVGSRLMRVRTIAWLAAGILCLAGLFWPTSSLVENALDGWPQALRIVILLWPSASVIAAAMLLARGLIHWQAKAATGTVETTMGQRQARRSGTLAGMCFTLSALVLVKAFHNLYWLLVWDSTYDPLKFFWLIPTGLAGIFGALLLSSLPGRARWAAVYGLVLAGTLVGLLVYVHNLNFRQLTVERAERVAAAVRAYHAREGHYPLDLRQLTPGYLLTVPGPVIINGQSWCYASSGDSFRLGYVDRDHWSSPNVLIRLHASAGITDALPTLCEVELAAINLTAKAATDGWGWPVATDGILARLKPGLSRTDVLQGMYEVWHRDGCSPQRPLDTGQYAYTDLFWLGSRNVTRATIIAVHYVWEGSSRSWIVNRAEVAANDQLYELYGHCLSLELETPRD